MATLADLKLRLSALYLALQQAQKDLAYDQKYAPALVPNVQSRIDQIQADIDLANQQLAQLEGSTTSAGAVVRDDQIGTGEGANPQNPLAAPLVLDGQGRVVTSTSASPSNATALVNNQSVDEGTDAPTRTITQTQATSLGSNEIGQGALLNPTYNVNQPNLSTPPYVVNNNIPGVGAGRDDTATVPPPNATRAEIDSIFNETQILPQSNVLDQYASYTYVASVYLMNSDSYNRMIKSKSKNLNGAQLLFQSGGASVQGRNQYFSNDYYIDKVNIRSKILGKGTGAPHNVVELSMTVIEPTGITLIDNLNKAVQGFLGGVDQKQKGFTQPIYLLVLKFYGYDDQGNLVRGGVPKPNGGSDANAFVEKWYPFILSNVGFKIANKVVEYNLECKPVINMINYSSSRGSIPYNIELAGQTLKDLLAGPAVYSNNQSEVTQTPPPTTNSNTPGTAPQAPQKATAAPTAKTTVRQGLMAAMNDFQQQLFDQGKIAVKDEYQVEFLNDSLANAKITKKGTTVKKSIPMSTDQSAAAQKDPNKQSADTSTRTFAATAGVQIVQFLDQIIKNSSYIEDQQILVVDEKTGQEFINGKPGQNVAWYKISFQTEQLAWDEKRNDYAYRIKYIIQAYRINQIQSKYFPIPQFKGVVKQYKYWFTGENTQVLSYEENLNTLYKVILSGALTNTNLISSANAELKYAPQPRSGESSQGAQGATVEIAANASDSLMSPSDLKECSMSIVGDPAWLQQGEAFAGFYSNDANAFSSFLPDGTINIDSQQPMFEVAFNTPKDYNLDTGLMEQNPFNQFNLVTQNATNAQYSRLYIAKECESRFDKGKFTQQLHGILYLYNPATVNQYNQQLSQNLTQQLALSMSQNRNLNSMVNGILSTVAYAPLASTAGAPNYGQNLNTGAGVNLINSVLGGIGVRNSPVATAPTSSGIPVGTVNGAGTIGTATGVSTEIANAASGLGSTTSGTTQPMAAGDDSGGYTSNVSNPEDPFANTTIINAEP